MPGVSQPLWLLLIVVALSQGCPAAASSPVAEYSPAAEYPKPAVLGVNTQCRYAPSATHDYCGLPIYLANFQGKLKP